MIEQQYFNNINIISEELSLVDNELKRMLLSCKNSFTRQFFDFIFSNSKKIRSTITILFIKMIRGKITKKQLKLCALIELLHNASLIHDDIVDNSDIRRNKPSFKKLFGCRQAVLAGDFLLSLCLKELSEINNNDISLLFAKSLMNICNGEIVQISQEQKDISIENYIYKSEQKTAELFKTLLISSFLIENLQNYVNFAENFGKFFGIAFQIRDDIDDFCSSLEKNIISEDIQNGIYTAPVIYFLQENKEKEIKILFKKNSSNSKYTSLANDLCSLYCDKALDLLSDFTDNQYKNVLIKLCNMLKKG